MAGGSFHSGSSHSGSYHSSGGGSHSSGGGSHYSSGGSSHHSSGGGGGGGSGGSGGGSGTGSCLLVILFFLTPFLHLIFRFLFAVCNEEIAGFNATNLAIFVCTGFMFIPSIIESKRTAALVELRQSGKSDRYVYSAVNTGDWNGSRDTMAGKNNKLYRIAFYGTEYGWKNSREVYNTMKRTPRIIWIRPGTWVVISIVLFIVNFFYYECVIPIFERMIMTDYAFEFFDGLTFYLPSFLAFSCAVLSLVFVGVRDKILYECAVRLASEIKTEEKKIETEMFLKTETGKKWYHNICPNCGAKASASLKHCVSCGSSLEVMEGDKYLNSIRRVRYDVNTGEKTDQSTGGKDG